MSREKEKEKKQQAKYPTDIHHRKPKCRGGDNSERNRVVVNKKRHALFHALFGTMTPEEIAEDLNNFWIDPDYKIKAEFQV